MKTLPPGLKRKIVEKMVMFVAEDPREASTGKNRSFHRSLKNALKGIIFTFMTGRNFRIEVYIFIPTILLGLFLGLTAIEWALILQSGFLVLALEAKNTSLELSVDLSTPGYHYGAKGSKDSASGAVLLVSLAAFIEGILILGPKVWRVILFLLKSAGGI